MVLPCSEAFFNALHQCPENKSQPKWVIKRSSVGGRGLFASAPIPRGTLIFVNKPLVIGPRADRAGDNYCTICYKIEVTCYPCKKCSLSVCSEKCNMTREHTTQCAFITHFWKPKENCAENSQTLAKIFTYFKFLLLSESDMEILSILQKSQSEKDIEELKMFLTKYTIPESHFKFMNEMSSVLKINSFRISSDGGAEKIPLRGIYPLSSFLNHNCVPNTRNVFTDDYTMAVYASKDIELGEEIFSCYTGTLWCTPARRCHLYKTKKFWCKCKRCEDRTEMNTRLSALKCREKECVGVLLPVNPLDPTTHWSCDNCEAVESPARVSDMQGVLGSLVGTLNLDTQLRLETFVLERLARFIPYSNHIFVDLRLRLALKLGFSEEFKFHDLSESRLSLKENLCRGTLRTLQRLGAGDAHLRGLLQYHLHATLAERARRHPHLYESLKTEIESTIEEAYHILQGSVSAPVDIELRRKYLGPGCDKPQDERFLILNS